MPRPQLPVCFGFIIATSPSSCWIKRHELAGVPNFLEDWSSKWLTAAEENWSVALVNQLYEATTLTQLDHQRHRPPQATTPFRRDGTDRSLDVLTKRLQLVPSKASLVFSWTAQSLSQRGCDELLCRQLLFSNISLQGCNDFLWGQAETAVHLF